MVILGSSYLLAAGLVPAGCGGADLATRSPAKATEDAIARAEDHERARRYDLARDAYREALESAPDNASAAFAAHRFASALAFWHEVPEAIEMLERAVELDPQRASAWHDLGILRANRGQIAGAETALRRAHALARSDPRPRIALAALLVKTRRFNEARDEYKRLLELDLPERTRAAIGRALELLAREPTLAPRPSERPN